MNIEFDQLNLNKWYWICQITGWSTVAIFGIISTYFYANTYSWNVVTILTAYSILNLLLTHFLKDGLKKKSPIHGSASRFVFSKLIFVLVATTLSLAIMYIALIFIFRSINILSTIDIIVITCSSAFIFTAWISLYTLSKLFITQKKTESEKLKLEIDLLKSEFSVLKSQIKPHFIFNAINNISSLIYENPNKARESLSALSNFLRTSINPENSFAVPLEKEISIVKGYLQLQQIQLGDHLRIKWDINQTKNNYLIPYLGFQTLVENSIKHGDFFSNPQSTIEINLIENSSFITIYIKNSGTLNNQSDPHIGIGLNNLRRRLQILNNKSSVTLSQETNNTVLTKLILYPNEYMYN
jgi:two-component system, LytTR family, sensor kinase